MAWNPDDEPNPDEPNVNLEDAVADAPAPAPRPMEGNQFAAAFGEEALPGEDRASYLSRQEKLVNLGAVGSPTLPGSERERQQGLETNRRVQETLARDAERQAAAQQRDAERQARAADVAGRREAAAGMAAQKKADAGRVKGLKETGVEFQTMPDGSTSPKLHPDGRLVYKKGWSSEPYQDAESGRHVKDYRDEFGNVVPKDLEEQGLVKTMKDGPMAGQKYFKDKGGVDVFVGEDKTWGERKAIELERQAAYQAHAAESNKLTTYRDTVGVKAKADKDAVDAEAKPVLADLAKLKNTYELAMAEKAKTGQMPAAFEPSVAKYEAAAAKWEEIKGRHDAAHAAHAEFTQKANEQKAVVDRLFAVPKALTGKLVALDKSKFSNRGVSETARALDQTAASVSDELKAASDESKAAQEEMVKARTALTAAPKPGQATGPLGIAKDAANRIMGAPKLLEAADAATARVKAAEAKVKEAAARVQAWNNLSKEAADSAKEYDAVAAKVTPAVSNLRKQQQKAFADAVLDPSLAEGLPARQAALTAAMEAARAPMMEAQAKVKAAQTKLLQTLDPKTWPASEEHGIALKTVQERADAWQLATGGGAIEALSVAMGAAAAVHPLIGGMPAGEAMAAMKLADEDRKRHIGNPDISSTEWRQKTLNDQAERTDRMKTVARVLEETAKYSEEKRTEKGVGALMDAQDSDAEVSKLAQKFKGPELEAGKAAWATDKATAAEVNRIAAMEKERAAALSVAIDAGDVLPIVGGMPAGEAMAAIERLDKEIASAKAALGEVSPEITKLAKQERMKAMFAPAGTELKAWDKAKDLVKNPEQLIPFAHSLPHLAEMAEVYQASKRVQAAIAKREADGTTEPDEDDLATIGAFQRAQGQKTSTGYKIWNTILAMPAFVGEFVLTGGIYSGAKTATIKSMDWVLSKAGTNVVKGLIEKQAARKLAVAIGDTVGAKAAMSGLQGAAVFAGKSAVAMAASVPQTAVAMAPAIAAGTLERMAPEIGLGVTKAGELEAVINKDRYGNAQNGKGIAESLARSFGEQYVEVFTEHSGGAMRAITKKFGAGAGKVLGAMGVDARAQIAKLAAVKGWIGLKPGRTLGDFAKTLEQGGFHGILEEMGEEYFGDAVRLVADTIDNKLQGPDAQTWQQAFAPAWEEHKPTGEKLGIMLASFAPMTAMHAVSNYRAERKADEQRARMAGVFAEQAQKFQDAAGRLTAEETAQDAVAKTGGRGASPENMAAHAAAEEAMFHPDHGVYHAAGEAAASLHSVAPQTKQRLGAVLGQPSAAFDAQVAANPNLVFVAGELGKIGGDAFVAESAREGAARMVATERGQGEEGVPLGRATVEHHAGLVVADTLRGIADGTATVSDAKRYALTQHAVVPLVTVRADGKLAVTDAAIPFLPATMQADIRAGRGDLRVEQVPGSDSNELWRNLYQEGRKNLASAAARLTAAPAGAQQAGAESQGGASAARRAHNSKADGSIPSPATPSLWNVEAVDANGNVATFTVPGGNEAAARANVAKRKGPGWTIQSIARVSVDGGAGSESAVGDENSQASATQGAVQGAAQGKGGQGAGASAAQDELLPARNAGQAAGTGAGNAGGAAVGASGANTGSTAGSAGSAKFYTGLGKNGQAGKRLAALERAGVKVIQTNGFTLARLNADGTTAIEINPAAFQNDAHAEAAVGEEIIHHFDNELMAAEWRKAVADGTFQGDAQDYRMERVPEILHDLRSRIGAIADPAERKAASDAVVAAFNLYYGRLREDAPLATTVEQALRMIADGLDIEGTPYQANVFTYAMELKRMLDQARQNGIISEETHPVWGGKIGAWVRDAIAAIKALAAKLLEMGHPLHASEMSKLARDAEALMAGTFAKGGTDVGGEAIHKVLAGGETIATGGAWASKNPRGKEMVRGTWALVPLRVLGINKNFGTDQDRINREQTGAAQRAEIVGNMTEENIPSAWGASNTLNDGSPIITPDGSVIIGNNRTMALRDIYNANSANGARARAYEDFARAEAARQGLDGQAYAGQPVVLVRVVSDAAGLERGELVKAANKAGVAAKSEADMALEHAALLDDDALMSQLSPGEDGSLNREFLQAFARSLADRDPVKDSKGNLDLGKAEKLAGNAMLAALLRGAKNFEQVLSALVTASGREGMKRTMAGVFRALPGLLKVQKFNPASGILHELGRALAALPDYRAAVADGRVKNVSDYLSQKDLFETPLEGKLLGYLAEGHSAAEIAKELGDYVAKVVAQGDPAQDQMFAAPAVDKGTMGGVLAKQAEGSAQWSVVSAQKRKRLAVLTKKGKLTASEDWEKAALERSAGQQFIPGAEGPEFALDRETAAVELKAALSDGMVQMQLLAKPAESLAGAELDEIRIPRSVRMTERTGHAIFEDWVHRDMEKNGSTHAEALAKFSFEDAVALARQRMAPLLAKMAEQPDLLDPSGAPGEGVRRYTLNQDRQMPAEAPGVEQPPPLPPPWARNSGGETWALQKWREDMAKWLERYKGPLVFAPADPSRERVGFVSKTPSNGKWRLTHFQFQQPSGHTDYGSKVDALEDAIRYYRRVDPGAVFAKPAEAAAPAEADRADGGRSAAPVNAAADLDTRFWSYRPRFILDRSIAVVQKVLAKLDELLGTNLTRFFKLKTADVVFMVKPLGKQLGGVEKVRAFLRKHGGVIAEEWTGIVDAQRIAEHYKNSAGKAFFPEMVKYMVGREVTAFRVKVDGSKIPELRKLIGDAQITPSTLRAEIVDGSPWKELYKEHGALDNGLHLSDSLGEGARESNVWFGIPPIVEGSAGAVATHKHLWNTLKKLCPSIRFGGSAYNGTAVPGKMDDLDYMLLAPNVEAMRAAVAKIPGLRLETPDGAVDPTSGTKYYKFEYDFPGGKADIAVVDQEAYRWFIHHNALAKYFPEQWKQEMIAEKKRTYDAVSSAEAANGKASAERKAAKAAYESVKRNYYAQVRRFFRLDELWNKSLPDETVPEAAVSARLASLPEATRELAVRAIAQLDPKTRGHILKRALTYPMPAMPDAVRAAEQAPPAPVNTAVAPTMEDAGNLGAQILDDLGDRAEIRWEKNGAVTESPKDHFRQPVNGYQHLLIQTKDGEKIHVTTPEMAVLRYFGKGEQATERILAALAVEETGGTAAAEAKAYRAMIGVSLTDYYASGLLAQASRTNSSNLSRSIWTPLLLSSLNEKFGKPGSSNRLQPKSPNTSYATGTSGLTPTTKNSTSIENSGSGGAFIQSEDTENAQSRQPGEENNRAQPMAKRSEPAAQPSLFDMLPVKAAAAAYVSSLPDKKPAAVKKAAVRDGMGEHADDLFDFAQKNPPKLTGTQQTSNLSNNETSARNPASTHRRPSAKSAPSGALDDLFSLMAGKREAERGAGTSERASGGSAPGGGRSDVGGDGVPADGVSAGEATGSGQRGGSTQAGGSELGGRVERGGTGPRGIQSADGSGGGAADSTGGSGARGLDAALPPLVERPTDPDARNFVIPRGATIAPRGLITKLKANIKAVKLLKAIQGERRNATAEEKAALVQFTGWGALSQAFDEDKAGYVAAGHLERDRKDLARYQEMQQRDIDAGRTGEYYKDLVDRSDEKIRGFENWEKKWGGYYAQIKEALTEPEWRRARASTINAHFTEGGVVSLMWDAVGRLGFRGGNVGEMAMGIGHFYGLMPQELQDRSKLFGVEMDPVSAGIGKLLYPEADIQNSAFQQADVADNSLDLNMGNVPFANIAIKDPAIKALDGPLDNLHDYYFAKMLQKTRPGGLICAISSAFTLDKMTATNRKWLAERADLVAAFRLPNDAFKENAGTDVVTDIIILRKKDGQPFEHGQAWTSLAESRTAKGEPIRVNEYFAAHPQNVLGLLADDGEMFAGREGAKEMTVHSDPTRPADVALAQAIDSLPADIVGAGAGTNVRGGASAANSLKMGNIVKAASGHYHFNTGGEFSPEGMSESDVELNDPKNRPRVAGFIGVRDALNRQYELELSPTASEADIEENRAELNRLYDAFKGRFEDFHHKANKGLFIDDPDYFRLAGAEMEEKSKGGIKALVAMVRGKAAKKYVKADVFRKRVLAPRVEPTRADSIEDAMGMSLGWRGRVDTGYIAQLTGQTREQVEATLLEREIVLRDPSTGQIQSREQYLSGNVRKKLEIAKASGEEFARNVRLLETAQPADVAMRDIKFTIGATWIPAETYREFMQSLGLDVTITYTTAGGGADRWTVEHPTRVSVDSVRYKDFEAGRFNADSMLDAMLNMRRIEVRDSARDGGKVNPALTAQAVNKSNELKVEFERWARDTPGVADKLAAIYNREVNGFALRTYDGQHLTFPWASNDFNIFPDKKNTVWRAIQEGFGLIAHGVGGGKTIVGSSIALELRRLGLAKKPMIVVHNATLEQFADTIAQIAPAARVLVGRKDELQGAKRKEFLMRIAAGDWDAVVVAHSTFNLIADDPVFMRKQMENLVDELKEALMGSGYKDLGAAKDDRKKNASVKQMVKMVEELEAKITEASRRATDSDLLSFQQLGVDALIVDEVHKFKKMPFATKLDVKGIDGGMSKSGYGLLMRARGIQEKAGGKNVFTMTGTPVTNTLGEVWNQVRLVAPHLLKEYGIEKFDQFVSKFATVESKSEADPTGARKMVERLAKIINLPEWATFFRMAADVKFGEDMVTAGRPDVKGGKPELVAAERTKGATAWVNYIRQVLTAFKEIPWKEKQENPALMGVPVTAYMASRAAAIDIRLIEPRAKDEPGSKVNLMIERAMGIYKQTGEYKGTQVIFADAMNPTKVSLFDQVVPLHGLGIPLDPTKEPGTTFHLYDDIRMKLIKRGVPESQIAVLTDKKYQGDSGEKAKKALWEKVNAGEVRFVLGSTEKLGTGVNMQRLMAAAHHLDVPWTPAGLEQRDGRVLRQGNLHMDMKIPIELIRYGMKDTLDEALWGILERKQRFITSALSGKLNGREIEEDEMTLSLGEQMAILSGPYGQEMFETDNRLRELEYSRQAHAASVRRRDAEIADSKKEVTKVQAEIAGNAPKFTKLDRLAAAVAKDGAQLTVDGESFDTKKAMLEAVNRVIEEARADYEGKVETFRDMPVPVLTSIVANGVPIRLTGRPFTQTVYGEEQQPIGERMALEFSLEGLPWSQKNAVSDHFGEVKSAGTLLSRLDELGGRVQARRDAMQRNLERYTALANMDKLGAWPYQAEFDRKTARAAELVRLMAGSPAQSEGIIAPQSMPLLAKPAEGADLGKLVMDNLGLAVSIARNYRNVTAPMEDVVSEARLALVKAARGWQPDKGPFGNYAARAIRNSLNSMFTGEGAQARAEMTTLDRVKSSQDSDHAAGEETWKDDVTRNGAGEVTRPIEDRETREGMQDAIAKLPEYPRSILFGLMEGRTMEDIAEEKGVSKQAISKVAATARAAVKAIMQRAGFKGVDSDGVLLAKPAEPVDDKGGASYADTDTNPLIMEDVQAYLAFANVPPAKQAEAQKAIGRVKKASRRKYPLPATGGMDRGVEEQRNKQAAVYRGLAAGDAATVKQGIADGVPVSSLMAQFIRRDIPGFDIRGAVIERPEDVAAFVAMHRTPFFESSKILVLDGNNQVIHSQLISVGALNETFMGQREVTGVIEQTRRLHPDVPLAGFILSHNHPSGDPTPSSADIRMTGILDQTGTLIGVPLLDHVVTNGRSHYSFREMGHISGATTVKETGTLRQPRLPVPARDLADWEAIGAGAGRISIQIKQEVDAVTATLKTADPDHMHVLIADTKLKLIAVNRYPLNAPMGEIARDVAAAGGYGAILSMPSSITAPVSGQLSQSELGLVSKFSTALKITGMRPVDVVSAGGYSAASAGLVGETTEQSTPLLAKPAEASSLGAGQGMSVGGVLVESALDQAQIAREREATLKKLDPPTPGGTMMPGEKLSVMGDIYSFLFKGWKDAMERGAPGTKDAVDAGEIRAAKAAAATREMMERMMADARAGLEAVHGGKGKALFKQFAAELLPTASRLNATGVDVDGNPTFSTFDQRAGIIFKNQAEASGVTTGQWLERGTEFLKVGNYIEDAGGYQLLRELTPERQQAIYDTFMERFNGAGHYLTLWISPDMADARVTDSRGTVLPEFNRHALRKFFGEVSPHGELDAVEGYVPEIQRTRSLAGMIGQGVTNLLNKNFKSGAREYKSGQARETGEVKNLFEGFAIRAMEAHAERSRREMAERLIPLAVKDIPAVGGVPSGWMAVNTHALPQLAQAYGAAMGMTKEQLVKWTNAVATQDMDALRKLCGKAWQDLTGNKMMRKEVFAALVRPMAATQSGSAIMRFFASMTRAAVAAFLVRPSTAFMNFVGNEVFKGMRLIQQAQVSVLLRKADPQGAKVAASEAWNLTKGIITNRWFIPARRRMMDAVAPVEYSEGNSQIAGAAQSMTEAKMTAWEHLKQANVPAALLKLTRFGEMDPRAKQQLQYASLIAHAEVAAEDAEKQGFQFANRKQRMQWMQAWLAKQGDDLMVQARAVGLAYAMDYDNVPWWLDPGHRFAVGTVDMTPVVNVVRNLMLPYFRWTYNYLRNTKRWLGGGSADVVTWLGAKVASAPFLAGTEAGKRMKAAAEERGVPEMNPKLANSIANLGTFVLMQAAAYALLHLGRGGGDDDKDRVDRLGRSFDQAGKRMDRAFDTSSRMDISDIPVLGTATRALARMFGEQKDGDSYWLRTRQIPYASVLLATATSLDALGADKAHARGLATEAANMWREFASDLVSEGILMTVVNKVRGNESKYTGSQSVSTTLGGMATDFALARVAPQPLLSMVRDLVDPQQRRLTPNEKLGYEPGVVEGVKSRLPFASKTLPPAGKIKTKLLDNAVEELGQLQAKGHTNATNFGVNKDGKPTATFVDPADDRRLPRWKTLLGYGLVNIKPVDKAGYERAVHGEEGDYKRELRKAMLNGKR